MKLYKIVLRNSTGETIIENIERISFPEAASYAYLLRTQKGLDFDIVSVSEQ